MTSRISINTKEQGVWFTSDTHFGHKNIIKFCEKTRPFEDVAAMDAALIANWNAQVQPNDIVFHLGDFCFGNLTYTKRVLEQLNGRKVLIYGNHDQVIRDNETAQEHFEACVDYLRVKVDGVTTILMHFPIFSWDCKGHGAYHLHGHTHAAYLNGMKGRFMDVGVDSRHDQRLWSWAEIHDKLQAVECVDWN